MSRCTNRTLYVDSFADWELIGTLSTPHGNIICSLCNPVVFLGLYPDLFVLQHQYTHLQTFIGSHTFSDRWLFKLCLNPELSNI